MDLRKLYQAIRLEEAKIAEDFPVVVSKATAEGGRDDVYTEVTRAQAARLVVEDRARLATQEEAAEYRRKAAEERQRIEEAQMRQKVSVTVISDAELESLKTASKKQKS